MQPRLYFACAVATLLTSAAAWPAMSPQTERTSCQIIDRFRDFIDLAAVVANASADQQLAAFHNDFLNPSNSLSDALIAPRDLEVQARPLTAMLAHLEGPTLRKEIGDRVCGGGSAHGSRDCLYEPTFRGQLHWRRAAIAWHRVNIQRGKSSATGSAHSCLRVLRMKYGSGTEAPRAGHL
jgi:hypothetical protein